MADVHDQSTRSRNMAAIQGRNTKPELQIRKALHAAGLRYRLHVDKLPGKPDLVFRRHKAVIFVNGCFWHRHQCHLFKWPKTRAEFWQKKIARNKENDARAIKTLKKSGWRVGIVWECALKGRARLDFTTSMCKLTDWVKSDKEGIVISGEEAQDTE